MQVSDLKTVPQLLAEDRHIFGVLTTSEAVTSDVGVIILNAGLLHNVGPFRLHVDLANALAASGARVVRIDQSGKGESASRSLPKRQDTLLKDYDDACATLGVDRTIIIGLCSGADDALLIADQNASVAGLVLLDGYARQNSRFQRLRLVRRVKSKKNILAAIARKLLGPKRNSEDSEETMGFDIREWKSDDEMVNLISGILQSDTRILALFTSGQDYYNYDGQLGDSLGGESSNLREVFFDGVDHTYSRSEHRETLVDTINNWFVEEFMKRSSSSQTDWQRRNHASDTPGPRRIAQKHAANG